MSASPNLKLPYVDANQNQKSVTHNEALRTLDALVNLRVATNTLVAPPVSPADGQRWIVASGGSGAWLGKDLNVAAWQDGAWTFYAPNPGFVAYVDSIGGALMWNGTAWVSLLGVVSQLSLNALGIGTAADGGNPLSAKLNGALLAAPPTTATPAGSGDVRLKLSKQSASNVASLLFQDNYAGRAEVGLVGDDNFHFKVSPDGSTFYDAIVVTAAGGGVSFLGTPTHPSPGAGENSTASATTAWVKASFVTYAYAGSTYATASNATLTGTPTAPTQATGDNSTRIATTAYADRATAAIVARTQVNDTAYTVLPSDRTVAVIALTAARVLTLPSASAYPQGATLTVVDESGACSAANTLTLVRAGSDTINGASSAVVAAAYGYIALESNGSGKWTIVDQSALSMAQQPSSSVAISGGTINGTAIGATTASPGSFTTVNLNSAVFPSTIGAAGTPNKIILYSGLGFGVSGGSLDYCANISTDFHSFYYGGTLKHRLSGVAGNTYLLSLDNTPIGATTPSTIKGTTLTATASVNLPSYTVATLPAAGTAGRAVYCSNARMFNGAGVLEGAAAGTGGLVTDNGTAWKIAGTNITVSA